MNRTIEKLVKIADRLDQNGKSELADEVDKVIRGLKIASDKEPIQFEFAQVEKEIQFLRSKIKELRQKWFTEHGEEFGDDPDIKSQPFLPGAIEQNMMVELLKAKTEKLSELQSKLVDPVFESFEDEKDYGSELMASDKEVGDLINKLEVEPFKPQLGDVKCDCGRALPLRVLKTPAGFYTGRACGECGPYSRESEYFKTKEEAEELLKPHDEEPTDEEVKDLWK